MADSKITALTALTAADPVNDMFPVVDVSDTSMAASGTTKRISVNNILSSSPTASGALTVTGLVTAGSATITGAATVGTTLGVTGVSTFAAGTALLPSLTTTGDVNTGIYYPAADTFAVTTGGTERYRVDSSGNLGLGVAPTSTTKFLVRVAADKNISFETDGSLSFYDNARSTTVAGTYTALSHAWKIGSTGASDAMVVDTSGNLIIGATSLINGTAAGSLNIVGANSQQIQIRNSGATAGNFWRQAVDSANTFYILNNATAGVSITSGATSWSAVSDERLKDIIEPISNAIEKVGSLRSVIGKYKNDETNIRRSFLIAQDVQSVLPEAVDSSKPNELGLRYTEVIPLLVAAIKELTARVQTLEAR